MTAKIKMILGASLVAATAACQPTPEPAGTVAEQDNAAEALSSKPGTSVSAVQAPAEAPVRDLNIKVVRDQVPFQPAAARVDGDALVSTGTAGFLMFGPYTTLESGRYTVTIEGQVDSVGTGELIFDVASNGETFAQKVLTETTSEGQIAVIDFELVAPTPRVEIRSRAGEDAKVRITGYRVTPTTN